MALKKRPLIKTFYSPHDIAGSNMSLLEDHFKASNYTSADTFDKAISKKFSDEYREIVANIHDDLKKNGFYVSGILASGRLIFSQLVSNDGILYDTNMIPVGQKTPTRQEILQMKAECRANLTGFSKKSEKTISYDPNNHDLSDVQF